MTNEQDSEMNKDSCVQKVSAFMQQDGNTVESSNNFLSTKKNHYQKHEAMASHKHKNIQNGNKHPHMLGSNVIGKGRIPSRKAKLDKCSIVTRC
jgi:hypothetical protein